MKQVLLLLCALLALPVGAPAPALAQDAPAQAAGQHEYTDATGQAVPYGMNAQRIVSLAPNLTEMVCFLGLDGKLAGRSDFCNYPPQVAAVPSVGGFADASLERIVSLKPDLVLAYQGNDRELVDQLRQLGLTVLALREATSLEEVGQQMEVVCGVAAPPGAKPSAALSDWRERLKQLSAPGNVQSRATVFFGYPGEMSVTCGPGTFLSDLISRAGGANVLTNDDQRWPLVSAEFVLASQPDWLLSATSCTRGEKPEPKRAALLSQLRKDPVWSKLQAVQAGRVCVIDADVLLRPGPRILDALSQLEQALQEGRPR
jgi:iron complex transport system substrate-binding protein